MPDIESQNTENDSAQPEHDSTNQCWLKRWCKRLSEKALENPLEAILTIATVLLAVFTFYLWDATKGLLKSDIEKSVQAASDLKESLMLTRQAADAATRGALATQGLAAAAVSQVQAAYSQASAVMKSNEIAVNAMIKANQPFITLNHTEVSPAIFEVDKPWKVIPIIHNSGNSGANDVYTNFRVRWVSSGHQGDDILDFKKGSQMLVPKDSDLSVPMIFPASNLTKDNIASFEKGQIVIELLGRIDYSDSFDRHHVISICQYIDPDPSLRTFTNCGKGNYETIGSGKARK